MGIKVNCANPACRQRVEVDDALAGQSVKCPGCSSLVEVPLSKDIRFNCSNSACLQHIVVDVSEAGRVVRCPKCGAPSRIPGSPPKSWGETLVESRKQIEEGSLFWDRLMTYCQRFGRWPRLGAVLIVCLIIFSTVVGWANHISNGGLPEHMEQMADEIYAHGVGEDRGSAVETYGDKILYLDYVNNDADVYSFNKVSKQKRRLKNIDNVASDMNFTWIGGSPDRHSFAYCTKARSHGYSLDVCDASNGVRTATFQFAPPLAPTSGVWIGDDALAVGFTNGEVYVANIKTNASFGKYGAKGVTRLMAASEKDVQLTAVSMPTFAYVQGNAIWTFNLASGQATKLVDGVVGDIGDLSYDESARRLIYTVTHQTIVSLYASEMESAQPKLLASPAHAGRWVQNGKGFIFTQTIGQKAMIQLMSKEGVIHSNIFNLTDGEIQPNSVTGEADDVYGIVSDSRGESSVLDYHISADKLERLIEIQPAYLFSRIARPIEVTLTNEFGVAFEFYYREPTHLDPTRQYPVLMDMTSSSRHEHGRDALFLANCGIYYVSPNSFGITQWGITPKQENVMAVYDWLLRNANVNSRQIYIGGQSVTSRVACEMASQYPDKWRGLIMLEPIVYPEEPADSKVFPSVFMSIGDSDRYNGAAFTHGRAESFMQYASAHLISARLYYQADSMHSFGPRQFKSSYKSLVKFIQNDY